MAAEHIVRSYDEELGVLGRTLLSMAALVRGQFQDALLALKQCDEALARQVIARDPEVDQQEITIGRLALQILALRQPVAFDLRFVVATLKMANHLERMADYGANIARRVLVLGEHPPLLLEPPLLLFKMGDLICAMMTSVLDGFREQNKEVVEKAWEDDQEVDQLYNTLLRELLTFMMEDSRRISICAHYLFIAKNIERAGDHVTNLGEIVAVMVRGKPLGDVRHPLEDAHMLEELSLASPPVATLKDPKW